MSKKGLCDFDIDNTLTRAQLATPEGCGVPSLRQYPSCHKCEGDDNTYLYGLENTSTRPGAYAFEAVQRCKDMGYNVAIATASNCSGNGPSDVQAVQSRFQFLKGMGFPDNVVSASGAAGPALQCANALNGGNKEVMVRKLIKTFHADPRHTMFFDDNVTKRHQVRNIPGVVIGKASVQCGGEWCPTGCGLQKREFDDAVRREQRNPR